MNCNSRYEYVPVSRVASIHLGGTPKRNDSRYWGGTIKWASAADISACETRYIRRTTESITDLGLQKSAAKLMNKDTVVITSRGTVGKLCMLPEPMTFNQTCYGLEAGSVMDSTFLFFALKGSLSVIKSQTYGAVFDTITKNSFDGINIPFPPFQTQTKIASVLSAYDDLIENSTRRIKILESMAQSIYREWFVNFRFPGHDKVKMVDSPLGMVPEGWKVLAFTEIADVLSGGTPKTTVQEYWGGSIPFFLPKYAPESFYVTNTEKTITEIGLKKCNSKLYPRDTVFITARGTVGKVVMSSSDMAMSQSCYALRGKQGISQPYLFLTTRELVDYLKKNTGGATFDTIVVDTFRRLLVTRPPHHVIVQFSQLIQPLMELILNILRKNITLRQTRDIILPRLISGEIDVIDLDIQLPEELS